MQKQIEAELNILLPNTFQYYSPELQQNIIQYIKQLTPIEKKAYSIALEHLGSSFNILRCNGYKEWIKNK
jgi:hypothetical protein